ncbi:hypothetical protein HWV62_24458 [Athelia sp. TMB]|nr:hypothetical protein HWV62_24458 [Athelia sp. TMB]
MKTRNIKHRRPVVGSTPKVAAVDAASNVAAVEPKVDNEVEGKPTVAPLSGRKRVLAKAITPEYEDNGVTVPAQSPSKTRVKPSERVKSQATTKVVIESSDPAPPALSGGDIVFTDDEDFVSVSVSPEREMEDGDEPEEAPELVDLEASEAASDEDSVARAGTQEAEGTEYDSAEEGTITPPVFRVAVPVEIPVGRKRRTKVAETLDKMETERDMYVAARKKSVASIASTNPGDGTKRLHGEESYIHDDIQDSPFGNRAHANPANHYTPTGMFKPVTSTGRDKTATSTKPGAPVTPTRSPQKSISKGKNAISEDYVHLTDSDPRGEEGPAVCEVANKNDMDPIIDYTGLANLFGDRHVVSWSQLAGPGLAVPSAWHEENPAISMSQLRGCIQFKNSDYFYNPSRMTPSDMGLYPYPGNSYIVEGGTTRVATMTTAILVTSSNIYRMKEVFGEDRRMISGIPHITEWQRMESAILMALRMDTAHAQLAQQAITFSTTRTMGTGTNSPSKNPSRMFRQPAGASSSGNSPFAVPLSNIQGSGYVPVLDARHTRFSLKKLVGLDKVLPNFNAEVPEGSLAWVGYTVNKYTTTRGSHLNFNLLWVVVMGTPE